MIVLGLTGSIGMGKTTAAQALSRMGLPVHDSDSAVHRLFAKDGAAVEPVSRAFPAAIRDDAVDRVELGSLVFRDKEALARLEEIVHPLVREDSRAFLKRCGLHRRAIAVLDVPLLFEVDRDGDCDFTILVTAPSFIQAQRVLRRPGMTEQRLAEIRSRQMPDWEKRRRADFIVETGLGKRESLRRLLHIVRLVREGKKRPAKLAYHA